MTRWLPVRRYRQWYAGFRWARKKIAVHAAVADAGTQIEIYPDPWEERGGRSQRSWAAVVSTVNALVVRIPRVDLGLAGPLFPVPSVFTKIIRDGQAALTLQ